MPEYYSVDQVLRELQVNHDELQRLIAEGEIKPYSDGHSYKFLRSEILTYKAAKMDMPTIPTMANRENSDAQIIDEITSDGGELIHAEISSEDDNIQPLFSMNGEEGTDIKDPGEQLEEAMAEIVQDANNQEIASEILQEELPSNLVEELKDDEEHLSVAENPMELMPDAVEISEESIEDGNVEDQIANLEISDEAFDEDNHHLEELRHDVEENDTGELKFENADNEFMETGEVLSESVQKEARLPLDKQMEDLFPNPDSEEENENFQSQTHIKDEVDMNDDEEPTGHEDQALGVAKTEIQTHIEESSNSKTKILIGVILLALLGGVSSSFIFWNPLEVLGLSGKPVDVVLVNESTQKIPCDIAGQATWFETAVHATESGMVETYAAVGTNVNKGDKIATIAKPNPAFVTLMQQKQNIQADLSKADASMAKFAEFTKNPANKKLMDQIGLLKNTKTKAAATAALSKNPLKKLYAEYNALLRTNNNASTAKKTLNTQLKEIDTLLAKTPQNLGEVEVVSPDAGKIKLWHVTEEMPIQVDNLLVTIQSTDKMQLVFQIRKEDAIPYTIGNPAALLNAGQTIDFVVEKADNVGDMVQVITTIENAGNKLTGNAQDGYIFQYAKDSKGIMLRKDLIRKEGDESYVLVARDNKVVRQSIQYNPIYRDDGNVLVQNGLIDGDYVISTSDAEIVPGVKVSFKK